MVGLIGLVLEGSHVEYVSNCFWTLDSVSTMYLLKLGPALNSFQRILFKDHLQRLRPFE